MKTAPENRFWRQQKNAVVTAGVTKSFGVNELHK